MPTFILWGLWIIGGFAAVMLLFGAAAEEEGSYLIWPLIFAILCCVTIPWYLKAAKIVHALPDIKERVGIVEISVLPNGTKISIVKTDTGIINLSDTLHCVVPDGAVYYRWEKQIYANGLSFLGRESAGSYWELPEAQR
jgi:hypothetical protein